MTDPDIVAMLRAKYRSLVVEWNQASEKPKIANRKFDALHKLYKELRDSPEGQLAIAGLMDDPNAAVRLSAATHSLAAKPERAVAVIQEIEQGGGREGFNAKWTLKTYRDGTLNLDW